MLFSQEDINILMELERVYKTNNVDSLDKFINTFAQNTKYVEEAIRIRDRIAYEETKKENTTKAYRQYIEKYPNSIYIFDAKYALKEKEKIKILQKEEEDYKQSLKENTIASLERFIKKYPHSSYNSFIKEKIEDMQYSSYIHLYSIDEITNFLSLYPKNKNNTPLIDTLKWQTLEFLSYKGLLFLYNNGYLYNDTNFVILFSNNYIEQGDSKKFERLIKDFPFLKKDKEFIDKKNDAKKIESIYKLNNIDNKTFNANKEYFHSIKNDKSYLLIKKYFLQLNKAKKISQAKKLISSFNDNFILWQYENSLSYNYDSIIEKQDICFNKDSSIKVISKNKDNSYGGKDLFISLKEYGNKEKEFILPKNINTPYDELYPKINNKGNVLYFYSTRPLSKDSLSLYVSLKMEDTSWRMWSEPIMTDKIVFVNAEKNYVKGYVLDQDNNPMDATIFIENEKTGNRLFVTKSNALSGGFLFPKSKSEDAIMLSMKKGYISNIVNIAEKNVIVQENIDLLFERKRVFVMESFFKEDNPTKLSYIAEKYLYYLAQSLKESNYIITISLHYKTAYKNLSFQDVTNIQATLIKEKLISFGINYNNIVVAGYGNSRPLIGWEEKNRIEVGFMKIDNIE